MPRIHIPEEHAHDPLSYAWSEFAPEIGAAAAAYSLSVYENSKLRCENWKRRRCVRP